MSESLASPPWRLTGDGWIIFYRFDRNFALRWIPAELHDRYVGGTGAVVFVNYNTSPVGAYGELMFIPGRFQVGKKPRLSITRIFVSTYSSMMGGRANWGIPKERADFHVETTEDGLDKLSAAAINGDPIAELRARAGLLKLPLPSNRLFPLNIVQWGEGQQYVTRFWGRGGLGLMDVEGLRINSDLFPDVSRHTPVGAIKMWDFKLTFGVPKIT